MSEHKPMLITLPLYSADDRYARRSVTFDALSVESLRDIEVRTGDYGITSQYTRVRTRSGDEFTVAENHSHVRKCVLDSTADADA